MTIRLRKIGKEPKPTKIRQTVGKAVPFYRRMVVGREYVFRLAVLTKHRFVGYSASNIVNDNMGEVNCSYHIANINVRRDLALARYRLQVLADFLARGDSGYCFTTHISDCDRLRSVAIIKVADEPMMRSLTLTDCNNNCTMLLYRDELAKIADMFRSALLHFDSEMERLGIKVEKLSDE